MLCNNCGSLDHWEKNCPKPRIVSTPKGKMVVVGCEKCVLLQVEVSRLRAKYEMTAEEKLARIQEQRRVASRKYAKKLREKCK